MFTFSAIWEQDFRNYLQHDFRQVSIHGIKFSIHKFIKIQYWRFSWTMKICIITWDKLYNDLNFKDEKIGWYFLWFFTFFWKGSQQHEIQSWKFETSWWFTYHDLFSWTLLHRTHSSPPANCKYQITFSKANLHVYPQT